MQLLRKLSHTILLISFLLLIVSCASTKYLGTKQTSLAADACTIATKQCFFANSSLDNNGQETEIRGSFSLESTGDGTYRFTGSVKFEHESPIIKNIKFLDLTFVFFNDDIVVHEEKIRVKGRVGNYLEFSRLIKSDLKFESSEWVWFNWSANELEVL